MNTNFSSYSSINRYLYLFCIAAGILLIIGLVGIGVRYNAMFLIFGGMLGLGGLIGLIYWTSSAPWRSAAIILALAPFQVVLTTYFGVFANIFTSLIIVAFLFGFSKRGLNLIVLGNFVQKLTLLFVLSLGFSVVIAFQYGFNLDEIVDYFQKIALFFVVTILITAFRTNPKYTRILFLTFIVSMTIFCALSIADFYFGISLLPNSGLFGTQGLISTLNQNSLDLSHINHYRLRGVGSTMSVNRFALWAAGAFLLGFGYLLTNISKVQRFLVFPILAILFFSVVATGSRSGILGLGIGIVVFLVKQKLHISLLAILIVISILISVSLFNIIPSEILTNRFTSDQFVDNNRNAPWQFALNLFWQSPVFGVGSGGFTQHYIQSSDYDPSASDAHSAYLELLSERGLIATLPFIILVSYTLYILVRHYPNGFLDIELQHACLATFVMILVTCIFNTYQYERFVWLPVAVAAVLDAQQKMSVHQAQNLSKFRES